MSLEQAIEAVLFFKSESITIGKLAEILKATPEQLNQALFNLNNQLSGRGIVLIQNGQELMLGTAPEASPLIEKIVKDELSRDLGKASLEALAIVLYEGPVSKAEIDYIRGVNTSFILRNLMVRGLIERVANPNDARAFLYQPSIELLRFLGVGQITDLPDFEKVKQELLSFKKGQFGEPEKENTMASPVG